MRTLLRLIKIRWPNWDSATKTRTNGVF